MVMTGRPKKLTTSSRRSNSDVRLAIHSSANHSRISPRGLDLP
jgi:hypothetical protein